MLPTLLTIAALHWVVLVAPGVNFFLVSQLAAADRRRSAVYASLGITLVTLTWALLAVLGVGALFALHPPLRAGLQVAGGVYLCIVALRLWRAAAPSADSAPPALAPAAAFRMGFFTNIMNPKSALFFGSVFATALPSQASGGLLVAAVLLVYVNSLAWHLFLALAFSHPRIQGGYARQRARLTRLAGLVVGAFGLRLLAATVGELRAH